MQAFILTYLLFILIPSISKATTSDDLLEYLPSSIQIKNGHIFSAKDSSEMLLIPDGSFIMGNNNGHADEGPERQVFLSGFLIDRNSITNAQFMLFIKKSGYHPEGPWKNSFLKGEEQKPVRNITWQDALNYSKWAGKRLPTEAEWEKAARSTVGFVGSMWEWIQDWYDRHYYKNLDGATPNSNPLGPADKSEPLQKFIIAGAGAGNERSTLKVIRGSNFSRRMWGNPSYYFGDTGFRTAISLKKKAP